jgi:magnesium-transporting ATPase (P-type)
MWRDLLPADLIRISKDEIIPADALLLLTAGSGGIAYVETASLDGEKNLKPKFAVAQLQRYCNKEGLPDFGVMKGEVKCKAPSAEIEAFEGEVRLKLGTVEEAERVDL